jgi:GT2 family glycosyltransferase
MTKVSIVTGYQSQVDMTREFLDNLQAVSGGEYTLEMILVNAGCPEKITHPFITRRIDLPVNVSFANTMNIGIRAAHGDYVIVMNNDAFPRPGWIDKLLRYQADTGAWLVSPEVSSPTLDGVGQFIIGRHAGYAEVNMYPAVCWMLTRACIQQVGYFDDRFVPTMFEDNDYAKRVTNEGGMMIVVTDCQVEHRRSVENKANHAGNLNAIYAENERRFKEKWGL